MSKNLTILISLIAMCLALVGCEKKIGGVPAEKQISELSEEEVDAFNTYFGDTLKEMFTSDIFKESTCLSMSASFAPMGAEDDDEAVASCEESYEECLAEEDEEFDPADMAVSKDDLGECNVTMAQVDACLSAMLDSQKESAEKITSSSCEELIVDGKLEEIQGESGEEPEECKVVEENCEALN